jgi:hypothetical protein
VVVLAPREERDEPLEIGPGELGRAGVAGIDRAGSPDLGAERSGASPTARRARRVGVLVVEGGEPAPGVGVGRGQLEEPSHGANGLGDHPGLLQLVGEGHEGGRRNVVELSDGRAELRAACSSGNVRLIARRGREQQVELHGGLLVGGTRGGEQT